MENPNSHASFEEIYRNLDDQVRQAMTLLGDWTDQGRRLLTERPELVLAGIALGGFATGVLARQGESDRFMQRGRGFRVDPLLVFFGTAVAGFVFGPAILDRVGRGHEPSGPRPVERFTPH